MQRSLAESAAAAITKLVMRTFWFGFESKLFGQSDAKRAARIQNRSAPPAL